MMDSARKMGQVYEDESSSAVLSHHVGETPDIAEAYGRTGHGHDSREAAVETAPVLRHALQDEIGEEYQENGDRGHPLDEEIHGIEQRGVTSFGTAVGELVPDILLLHDEPDEYY